MSPNGSETEERIDTDDPRDRRARWESFAAEVPEIGTVIVRNHSHSDPSKHTYEVTVTASGETGECTCPSDEHQSGKCKHRRWLDHHAPDAILAATSGIRTDGGDETEPITCIGIEGIGPGAVNERFLLEIHEAAEKQSLGISGISIIRGECCDE